VLLNLTLIIYNKANNNRAPKYKYSV